MRYLKLSLKSLITAAMRIMMLLCLEVRVLRPRLLEIEGLQSFKELQSIDFDTLGETGLFGIFGPTGSGKSTILDAITLALYGNVQRANRGTQGIMNTSVNSTRVSFTFDLIKEGGRRTYRVERVYRRKKDSQNSVEARITRLFEISPSGDIIIADKQNEVNEAVIELLGLQFDDFTRSVVLPQNKFQEFLLSPKSEKTKMLERIFYLEEYGRQLAEKVNKKIAQVRNKLSGIEGAVSVLGDISEASLKEAEAAMTAAQENRDKIDEALKAIEKEYNAAKDVWELTSELADIRSKEQEHLLKADEIEGKKGIYEKAQAARSLEERISSYKKTAQDLEATKTELVKLDMDLLRFQAELEASGLEYEKAALLRKKNIPRLVERRTRLIKALETKKEIEKLEDALQKLRVGYVDTKKQISDREILISEQKAQLDLILADIEKQKSLAEGLKIEANYRSKVQKGVKLEEELNSSIASLEKFKSRHEMLAGLVVGQEQELGNLEKAGVKLQNEISGLKDVLKQHEGAKPGDRKDIMQEDTRFYSIKAITDTLRVKDKDLEQLQDRLRNFESQANGIAGRIDETASLIRNKHEELEGKRKLLEEQKAEYHKNTAYMLAKELKENEPCPVCGSTTHPSPSVYGGDSGIAGIESKITGLQDLVEKLEGQSRVLENECIKLEEQHNNLRNQVSTLQDDAARKQEERNEWIMKLPQELQRLDIVHIEQLMEELKEKRQDKLKAIDEWEQGLQKLEEELALKEREYNRYQIDISGKKSQLEANKLHLQEAQQVLSASETDYSGKSEAYQAFIKDLGIQSIKSELERIQNCDNELEVLQKSIDALEKKTADTRKELERLETEKQQLINRFSDIDAEGRGLKYQQSEKQKEIQEVAGDKDLNAEIAATDQEIGKLSSNEQEAQERLNSSRERYEKAGKEKNALEKQRDIFKEKLESETEKLRAELLSRGFSSIEEAENAAVPGDVLLQLKKEIFEFEETKKSIEAQKAMVEKKLKGRSITGEQWQETSGRYEELKLLKENGISAFESSRNKYGNLKTNYESWLSLSKEMKSNTKKMENLEQLKNLMKGNGFIEYISEERLRYVAKEASETLGTLTRHRYGLELDIENGFVIRDDSNGGIHRMVTSLSGGETFLTSLALALALSSQIQLKGQSPLEFFFLDEGFGTLDSNLLDTVVDALERLSTQKRVIGLISHVPELKNRIARRLIVEGPAINGLGSRVAIEKA
ncbi:MAG: SbcC/MukB-like Walker B domain-containing protein [Caulobacteraceae bacterium]